MCLNFVCILTVNIIFKKSSTLIYIISLVNTIHSLTSDTEIYDQLVSRVILWLLYQEGLRSTRAVVSVAMASMDAHLVVVTATVAQYWFWISHCMELVWKGSNQNLLDPNHANIGLEKPWFN